VLDSVTLLSLCWTRSLRCPIRRRISNMDCSAIRYSLAPILSCSATRCPLAPLSYTLLLRYSLAPQLDALLLRYPMPSCSDTLLLRYSLAPILSCSAIRCPLAPLSYTLLLRYPRDSLYPILSCSAIQGTRFTPLPDTRRRQRVESRESLNSSCFTNSFVGGCVAVSLSR
jgi:hypothetical protein